MERTLASLKVLRARYGLPSMIRLGSQAFEDFLEAAGLANDTLGVDPLWYCGRHVEFDAQLAPHEIAWDNAAHDWDEKTLICRVCGIRKYIALMRRIHNCPALVRDYWK